MDELRVLLENVLIDIETSTKECYQEMEMYDQLLKPWPVQASVPQTSDIGGETVTLDNRSKEMKDDLGKVEDLLQKARLLRDCNQDDASRLQNKCQQKGSRNTNTKPKHSQKKVCNQATNPKRTTQKPQLKIQQKPTLTNAAKSKYLLPTSESVTKTKEKVKAKSSSSVVREKPDNDFPKFLSVPTQVDQSNEKCYISFEDAVKLKTLPSKYKKLRCMHSKLVKDRRLSSPAMEIPSDAELSFIHNLAQGKRSDVNHEEFQLHSNIPKYLSVDAANRCIEACNAKCQSLKNALSAELPRLEGSSNPVLLHKEKVILSKANMVMQEIDNCFDWLSNCQIVGMVDNNSLTNFPKISLKCNDADLVASPCDHLTFKKSSELAAHHDTAHEILWTKMLLFLHQRMTKVLNTAIKGIGLMSSTDDDSRSGAKRCTDNVKLVADIVGLLTKKYTCSINPAVVYDN
ncbi:uncharacterized protein LOC143451703 isoform X1 [Clavelina lepadiformis]|uniref:uncharacterized protein LOC143451703 isoform X1 n=2 Tax=Clavelina lepadiformis TaxID=159417 RepID=UPI004042B13B